MRRCGWYCLSCCPSVLLSRLPSFGARTKNLLTTAATSYRPRSTHSATCSSATVESAAMSLRNSCFSPTPIARTASFASLYPTIQRARTARSRGSVSCVRTVADLLNITRWPSHTRSFKNRLDKSTRSSCARFAASAPAAGTRIASWPLCTTSDMAILPHSRRKLALRHYRSMTSTSSATASVLTRPPPPARSASLIRLRNAAGRCLTILKPSQPK